METLQCRENEAPCTHPEKPEYARNKHQKTSELANPKPFHPAHRISDETAVKQHLHASHNRFNTTEHVLKDCTQYYTTQTTIPAFQSHYVENVGHVTEVVSDDVTRVSRRACADPVLLRDSRVLRHLLTVEERYMPSPTYFRCVQKDIEPWMRNRVATWMLEVCEEQQCEEEVFPVAMNLLERVLSVRSIQRTQLQLLGAACMFLGSKLRETEPLSARKLVIYTDNSIRMSELMQWETLILSLLKWDLSAVTPHDFLPHIVTRLPVSHEDAHLVQRHATTFLALCVATEFQFVLYPPSMMAAASVVTALHGLRGRAWCARMRICEHLHTCTNIDYDLLRWCQEHMEKTLSEHLPQSLPSTPEKCPRPQTQPPTPTDVRDIEFR